MTNLNTSDVARETLTTEGSNLNVGAAVREAIVTDQGEPHIRYGGAVREAMVLDTAINEARTSQVVRETLLSDAPDYLTMTALSAVEMTQLADNTLTLRWSDDAGASWSDPVQQTIGSVGEYETSIQFRRLGMARSRVVELSWACGLPTALTGVFVEVTTAAT